MTSKEFRKHDRFDALNLLSYFCVDAENQTVHQGMGRTLNVSETGIRLETHTPLDPANTISLTIGLGEDLIDIRGRLVYSGSNQEGKYETGIEFFGVDAEEMKTLRKFIAKFTSERAARES